MASVLIQSTIEHIDQYQILANEFDIGFELIDFALPQNYGNRGEAIKNRYLTMGIEDQLLSAHGLYSDLFIASNDPQISQLAKNKYKWNLSIADELQLDTVVFHTNFIPLNRSKYYHLNWIKSHQEFFNEMANTFNTSILVENMWDSRPLNLAALMKTTDPTDVNICLDVGHLNIFSHTPMEKWFSQLGGRIACIHLNDNNGQIDQEQPPGQGSVDWHKFDVLVRQYCHDPSVVIEVDSLDKIKSAISFLQNHNIYPY